MTTAFDVAGKWYKGITHTHTTRSDGMWAPDQLANWYKMHGYDFCAVTDHLVCVDTRALSTSEFLTIPGIEIHGYDPSIDRTPHLVGLGTGIDGCVEKGTSMQGMIDQINQHGLIAIIAHPYWSSLRDADLFSASGYIGIEIYNHTCWSHVGKGDSLTYWDNLLFERRPIWGIATDDVHSHPSVLDIGGGWIVVKAPALNETAILDAIRAGHFYASQGPSIEEWRVEGTEVYVRCSPVEQIQVQGHNGLGRIARAPDGEQITEAILQFKTMPRYLRVTCIDAKHRRAWTNPVFPVSV